MDTSKVSAKNRVIKNSKKDNRLCGGDKLYGYGSKNPIIRVGENRNMPPANLFENSLTYHT
jgi:hypothetical protein